MLVDGRRINACLTLAVMQEGREITTIEGLARGDGNSPLHGAADDAAAFADGRIFRTEDPSAGEGYREILERHRADRVEAEGKAQPGDEAQKLSMHAFGAFVR